MMKSLLLISLAAPLLGAVELEITPYYEGRLGALSLTFDDGFKQEVEDALAILNPLEIRGTFFLIPLRMTAENHPPNVVGWERVREMIKSGHEIGTHGAVSEKLHEATDERLEFLINESWRILKEQTGIAPISYAAPGGSQVGEREARVIGQHHPHIRNRAFLPEKTRVIGYGSAGQRQWEDAATRKTIEEAMTEGGWVIATIHAIVNGYAPFRSKDEFRIHCEWLKSKSDVLWAAPMGEVGNYLRARARFQVEALPGEAGEIRFLLRAAQGTPADPEHPLTVQLTWPGSALPEAVQDGQPLNVMQREGRLLVNVPKGGVPVILRLPNR